MALTLNPGVVFEHIMDDEPFVPSFDPTEVSDGSVGSSNSLLKGDEVAEWTQGSQHRQTSTYRTPAQEAQGIDPHTQGEAGIFARPQASPDKGTPLSPADHARLAAGEEQPYRRNNARVISVADEAVQKAEKSKRNTGRAPISIVAQSIKPSSLPTSGAFTSSNGSASITRPSRSVGSGDHQFDLTPKEASKVNPYRSPFQNNNPEALEGKTVSTGRAVASIVVTPNGPATVSIPTTGRETSLASAPNTASGTTYRTNGEFVRFGYDYADEMAEGDRWKGQGLIQDPAERIKQGKLRAIRIDLQKLESRLKNESDARKKASVIAEISRLKAERNEIQNPRPTTLPNPATGVVYPVVLPQNLPEGFEFMPPERREAILLEIGLDKDGKPLSYPGAARNPRPNTLPGSRPKPLGKGKGTGSTPGTKGSSPKSTPDPRASKPAAPVVVARTTPPKSNPTGSEQNPGNDETLRLEAALRRKPIDLTTISTPEGRARAIQKIIELERAIVSMEDTPEGEWVDYWLSGPFAAVRGVARDKWQGGNEYEFYAYAATFNAAFDAAKKMRKEYINMAETHKRPTTRREQYQMARSSLSEWMQVVERDGKRSYRDEFTNAISAHRSQFESLVLFLIGDKQNRVAPRVTEANLSTFDESAWLQFQRLFWSCRRYYEAAGGHDSRYESNPLYKKWGLRQVDTKERGRRSSIQKPPKKDGVGSSRGTRGNNGKRKRSPVKRKL